MKTRKEDRLTVSRRLWKKLLTCVDGPDAQDEEEDAWDAVRADVTMHDKRGEYNVDYWNPTGINRRRNNG